MSLSKYTVEELNQKNEDRWTKGQLAQHVVLATQPGFDNVTKPVDRPYDKWAEEIAQLFSNQIIKMKAPGFIEPAPGDYHKEHLTDQLHKNKEAMMKIIETKELSEICMGIELPKWGHLTRYEWLVLILNHTHRHAEQMEVTLPHS